MVLYLYATNREIEPGEQHFIDYAPVYFSLTERPCECDA